MDKYSITARVSCPHCKHIVNMQLQGQYPDVVNGFDFKMGIQMYESDSHWSSYEKQCDTCGNIVMVHTMMTIRAKVAKHYKINMGG